MTKHASVSLKAALLSPRSIALVGATSDVSKAASRPLSYLKRGGYAGRVYPVNKSRATVMGEAAWPSLTALPERPDHVFIMTPTESVADIIDECGRLSVPVATILAGGFGDGGPQGAARERDLVERARRAGVRLLGPNSLGLINNGERVVLTANAALSEPELPKGSIFVASQSGSLIGALASRGKARGMGFSSLVSVGNEADLSIGEVCALTLADSAVDGYLLFLEAIRHADRLREFAEGAARQGKPVAAYLLGRSEEARELALSHTGALAGDADVAGAFLASCGIARVETFEALLECQPLLRRLKPPAAHRPRRSVGVVTTTGGGGAMIVDQLAMRAISVAPPSQDTLQALTKRGIKAGGGRLVDLTLAGARYDVMKSTLEVMLAAPEFDMVVVVVGSSARFQPETTVSPIIDVGKTGVPLAAFVVPDAPDALARLTAAGIPNFRTPEACADAIAAGLLRELPAPSPAGRTATPSGPSRQLDELEGYRLFDELRIARPECVVITGGDVGPAAAMLRFPVAAKVLSTDIAHKSDVGGVQLNLADRPALERGVRTIRQAVKEHEPHARTDRILVQPMMRGLGEALIGYRRDPHVGPIVMVASGGVLAELYRDRSIRMAPVDLETARKMIAEVRGLQPLTGYRGAEKGDLKALADAIVALSSLAIRPDLKVVEAEINPLLVLPQGQGAIALDALVRVSQS